jgi:hypothetical protein
VINAAMRRLRRAKIEPVSADLCNRSCMPNAENSRRCVSWPVRQQ